MIYDISPLAIAIFAAFVALTLGISFYLGRNANSSAGYFAAHGQIPWFVNGVAFAGDYLSAASFLGICGMIAFYGYDGFLYSIGYLAGWVVALFVIAEPMRRLGKFTFADALNAKFQSRGIRIAAGVSTLAVSVFYLIPQMVGAGVLVQPLLGLPHWAGVVLVGVVVILIVVTAGMVSTTWVQFLKGALLVVFSFVLVWIVLQRGLKTNPEVIDHYLPTIGPISGAWPESALADPHFGDARLVDHGGAWLGAGFLHVEYVQDGEVIGAAIWNQRQTEGGGYYLDAAQAQITSTDNQRSTLGGFTVLDRGAPVASPLQPVGFVTKLPGGVSETGPLGPMEFLSTLKDSEIMLWGSRKLTDPDGSTATIYYQKPTPGSQILRPGEHPKFAGIRSNEPGSWLGRLNFLSLMLALFGGTASLPHILIRYYTVKDADAARKSTIVGIAFIGFFYVLTLYLGLGAMTSGAMDVTDSNMAAPLLARSVSETLFAVISAIAFTTVLGTVSGLILASAGAVTHDLIDSFRSTPLGDNQKVAVAKVASVFVGLAAVALGILFQGMNVSYLVGWAFSVAASANLPSLVMLLFWRRTTGLGIIAAVIVGMVSSLAWILLSADSYAKIYGLPASEAIAPFSQPGLVTIPLGFLTLVVVSLLTSPREPAG